MYVTQKVNWVKHLLTIAGANAEFGAGNVTEWPLDGGALQIELGHHWTYVFINLGLGNDTSDFNITLTPSVWNTTGDGILCVDKVPIPENSGVTEGAIGTLQVITVGSAGTSLYNCADIRFTADAKAVNAPNCTASEVDYIVVEDQSEGGGHQGSNETEAGNSTAPDQGSDAGKTNAGIVALATFGGLAALFAMI